ncbi:hypothetical protein BGX33_012045 [Mortierella sp. NVP41]|nr:hypothetical protein BGX33_012045 [Mortierella sp. NVP41]
MSSPQQHQQLHAIPPGLTNIDPALEGVVKNFMRSEKYARKIKYIVRATSVPGRQNYKFAPATALAPQETKIWRTNLMQDEIASNNPFWTARWMRVFGTAPRLDDSLLKVPWIKCERPGANEGDPKAALPLHRRETYLDLRDNQNRNWAMDSFKEGIAFAQKGQLDDAIKAYSQAIQIDSKCVEAYIARGCTLTNMRKWRAAIMDFRAALGLDPSNIHARQYLENTIAQEEEHRLNPTLDMNVQQDSNAFAPASAPATGGAFDPNSNLDNINELVLDTENFDLNEAGNKANNNIERKRRKKKTNEHAILLAIAIATEVVTGATIEAEIGVVIGVVIGVGTRVATEAETEAETEAGIGVVTGAETEVEIEAGIEAGTEVETGAGTEEVSKRRRVSLKVATVTVTTVTSVQNQVKIEVSLKVYQQVSSPSPIKESFEEPLPTAIISLKIGKQQEALQIPHSVSDHKDKDNDKRDAVADSKRQRSRTRSRSRSPSRDRSKPKSDNPIARAHSPHLKQEVEERGKDQVKDKPKEKDQETAVPSVKEPAKNTPSQHRESEVAVTETKTSVVTKEAKASVDIVETKAAMAETKTPVVVEEAKNVTESSGKDKPAEVRAKDEKGPKDATARSASKDRSHDKKAQDNNKSRPSGSIGSPTGSNKRPREADTHDGRGRRRDGSSSPARRRTDGGSKAHSRSRSRTRGRSRSTSRGRGGRYSQAARSHSRDRDRNRDRRGRSPSPHSRSKNDGHHRNTSRSRSPVGRNRDRSRSVSRSRRNGDRARTRTRSRSPVKRARDSNSNAGRRGRGGKGGKRSGGGKTLSGANTIEVSKDFMEQRKKMRMKKDSPSRSRSR